MSFLDKLAILLVTVGALNWGSVGLFGFDFVSWLFGGSDALLTRIVFTLVGIAGVWAISLLFRPMRDEIPDAMDR
ncbi:MAG: DUF378 domain-containing protein [Clostridia bacterium]|nr:DUF378 domain-containing protein [Clostridia bacterium]